MCDDNQIYLGDNLQVLREHIADDSIDLIYLDPPFASDTDYTYLSAHPIPGQASRTVAAFADTWEWTHDTTLMLEDLRDRDAPLASLLSALSNALRNNGLAAYLVTISARLLELRRVLKPNGSLYLHCDASAGSYLKVILDTVFGADKFRNEIVWKRTSSHNDSKKWAHIHDTLLFYAGRGFTWNPVYLAHDPEYVRKFYRFEDERGRYRLHEIIRTASMGPRPNLTYEYKGYRPEWGWRMVREKVAKLDAEDRLTWSATGRPYLKRYLHEQNGTPCPGLWLDIPPLSYASSERLGYPTQKPLALLERIIAASSHPGDTVLDPFAGSGTSTHASQKMGRKWIAIDQSNLAVELLRKRLETNFPDCSYRINGNVATT
jgi:DNA modification methylase